MKNKRTEMKFKSSIGLAGHLFSSALCLGAVVLICSSASPQNLFMSDGYSGLQHNLGNIYKFTPAGSVSTFASGLDGPEGLAFDGEGNLFTASFLGNIYKFTPTGVRTTFASGLNYPRGLAFDTAGNLYGADEGNIYKFTPSGARATFASGLNNPVALAFDSAGNLFAACSGTSNIYKFTPSGARSTFASGLSYPYALAFDRAGNLFATAWGNSGGYVYKYTPDGIRSTFAQLGALGLAFDSSGNLFVMDGSTCNIYKFTPSGARTVFAAIPGLCMDQTGYLAFQPAQAPPASQLTNISTRENVLTGDDVLIGGFIITGSTSKEVLLRAIGPSLTNYDLSGCLADPTIELHKPDGTLITNDNWKMDDTIGQSQEAAIRATTIPPINDLESALLQTLPPGNYTTIVRAKTGTGIGLVEVYDMDQTSGTSQKLGNISTRGFVGTGDNVMIGGYIAGPAGPAKVIVRGIGPSLPVPGALSDPTLELHDGNGNKIASNDNWKIDDASGQSQETAIRATTIPPTNDLESAIVITLSPGAYTAILAGKNSVTGIGLVEIYDLQ